MVLSHRSSAAALAFVCLAYVGIRIFRLTDSCLWFDEIFSIHAAEQPWSSILSFVALDLIHPPLFYVLLKIWTGLGGESLFWLRLFPVVFAVIAIFPFLALCRELKLSFWTQIVALFFFAVNGSLIKYAQEVRMYAPMLCFSLFSIWLFSRYLNRGKGFIALLLINVLLVYTHYFGWLVLGAELATMLCVQRSRWRGVVTMVGGVFVCFLPWAIAVLRAAGGGSGLEQNIGWMTRPGVRGVSQFVLNLVEPFYYQASSADPISIFKMSVPIFMIAAAAGVLYFARRNTHAEDERNTIKYLSVVSILPLSAAFAVSWLLPYSIWGSRHLIIVFAPLSILFAIAITKIPRVAVQTAAVAFLLLFTGYALVMHLTRVTPHYIWCAWNDVAPAFIKKSGSDEPKIYVFEDLVAYHLWFALRNERNAQVVRVLGTGVSNDAAYFLPRGFDGVTKIADSEIVGEHVTIAFRSSEFAATEPPVSNLVSKGYKIIETVPFPVGRSTAYLCRLKLDK